MFSDLAYIDPVSGMALLSLIASAFIGTVTLFRRSIMRVVRAVFRTGQPQTPENSDSSNE